jgi:hypothetical protein
LDHVRLITQTSSQQRAKSAHESDRPTELTIYYNDGLQFCTRKLEHTNMEWKRNEDDFISNNICSQHARRHCTNIALYAAGKLFLLIMADIIYISNTISITRLWKAKRAEEMIYWKNRLKLLMVISKRSKRANLNLCKFNFLISLIDNFPDNLQSLEDAWRVTSDKLDCVSTCVHSNTVNTTKVNYEKPPQFLERIFTVTRRKVICDEKIVSTVQSHNTFYYYYGLPN